MYMNFTKFHIRCVDSVHFFLSPLKNLSETYNIDTLKGFFPHHFNRPENQNYIGPVPNEPMYGVDDMTDSGDVDTYKDVFKPWHDKATVAYGNN